MYASTAVKLATALFASAGLASPLARRDYTGPFNVVLAGSGPYEGQYVNTCHAGAGVQAFCVLNQTTPATYIGTNENGANASPFKLTYNYAAASGVVTEYLGYYQNSTSNIQAGFLGEYNNTFSLTYGVRSDSDLIGVYVNETSAYFEGWYVCPITYDGYTYQVVSYVPDAAKPDNADCAFTFLQAKDVDQA